MGRHFLQENIMSRPNIEVLQRAVDQIDGEMQDLHEAFQASGRPKMLASEQRDYEAMVARSSEALGRLRRAEATERRGAAGDEVARRAHAAAGLGRGADTIYARGNGTSYFHDLLAAAQPGHPSQPAAVARLAEHAQLVERAASDLPAEFQASPERRAAGAPALEQRVNPNRTDGQGGNFVPPLWLIDEYVDLLRNGRTVPDMCDTRPLPPGTDTVMLPKIATGTATGVQTADAAAVTSQDLTDTSISAPVKTIAGQQDIALQLFEQSPTNFDDVVFADLSADYQEKLSAQVLSGTGASGQVSGILPMAGINAVTYTDATPTLPEMLPPIAQAISQAVKNGKKPADGIALHPSLWYWFVSQLDTAGRPLVDLGNGMNSLIVHDAEAVAGRAGSIGNVPIYVDLNMPTNLGAGTNESRIIAGAFKQAYLWEGALRFRVMQEVLSGTLQVRLQLYNYVAFMPNRRPAAISVVSGTGLIPQAGF
jgi:HK97 family phage major capsid protein